VDLIDQRLGKQRDFTAKLKSLDRRALTEKQMPRKRSRASKKEVAACGLPLVDALANLPRVRIQDYVKAVSQYVLRSSPVGQEQKLEAGPKKAAQIRLSNGLGRALAADLQELNPQIRNLNRRGA
jgi:hypothetical protein